MRVLFVSSGNSITGISPIVKNQGESLKRVGIDLEYFTINSKGHNGYCKHIIKLKHIINNNSFDLIHAHYSLSAFVATLAGCKPLIVSLMGSDTKPGANTRFITKLLSAFCWDACIVKSEEMRNQIKGSNALIIPNGVNFNRFYPIQKTEAQKKVNFCPNKRHILFAADPDRKEKNYSLAKRAICLINHPNTEVRFLKGITHEEVVWYYCASDVVLLTSTREGSPNVIKEAMACNRPIVCSNVGDVSRVIGSTENCFVCNLDEKQIANKINYIFNNNIIETDGRKNILNLQDDKIAKRIIQLYESILKK